MENNKKPIISILSKNDIIQRTERRMSSLFQNVLDLRECFMNNDDRIIELEKKYKLLIEYSKNKS